jgi:hypothetical protein
LDQRVVDGGGLADAAVPGDQDGAAVAVDEEVAELADLVLAAAEVAVCVGGLAGAVEVRALGPVGQQLVLVEDDVAAVGDVCARRHVRDYRPRAASGRDA